MQMFTYDSWCLSPVGRQKRQGAPPVAESCSKHDTSRVPEMCSHESPL